MLVVSLQCRWTAFSSLSLTSCILFCFKDVQHLSLAFSKKKQRKIKHPERICYYYMGPGIWNNPIFNPLSIRHFILGDLQVFKFKTCLFSSQGVSVTMASRTHSKAGPRSTWNNPKPSTSGCSHSTNGPSPSTSGLKSSKNDPSRKKRPQQEQAELGVKPKRSRLGENYKTN